MKLRTFFVVVTMILSLGSCVKKDLPLQPLVLPLSLKSATIQPGNGMVPNELLVKFKGGVDENTKDGVLRKIGGKRKEKILTEVMQRGGDNQGLAVVSMPGKIEDAIAAIKLLSDVEYVEPNYIYTHQSVSNDPYYGYLWGMFGTKTIPANQYGSQAAVAWAAGHTGSDAVYIGLIDEGYMYTHEDLIANAGSNPGEIPGNGIDDDGNGYIDDVYGWDFVSGDNTVFDGVEDDHGTMVAGIMGAIGGNGIGVAGVCWNVKILNAKFLGPNGGTLANAIKAIDYFTNLKLKGVNIVATNNSWGGGGFSQGLKDAIERANKANILFVAAAGNDGMNTEFTPSYPSGYPNKNIIAVASINSVGALSYFSNYAASKVDLCAPGEYIASCYPVLQSDGNYGSSYAISSGTSLAAPFVTGAAALYAATHPNVKAEEIKGAIMDATTEMHSLEGKCESQGRLNISHF